MASGTITVKTSHTMQFVDITGQLANTLKSSGINEGVVVFFNPHTTAALTINEGADPAVQRDLLTALKSVVPFDLPYQHLEGNSPAHLMASLFGASEMVFIENGMLKLGTWQKIFFCEFDGPRTRKVHWRLIG